MYAHFTTAAFQGWLGGIASCLEGIDRAAVAQWLVSPSYPRSWTRGVRWAYAWLLRVPEKREKKYKRKNSFLNGSR